MAEVLTPNMVLGNGSNNDGLFGGGGGLIGGLILGQLLNRNGNGGLFGGGDNGGGGLAASNINTENTIAATERLLNARFDALAQADVLKTVEGTAAATQLALAVGQAALGVEIAKGQGEINTQVALTTGNLGTQNALNAAAIQTLVQKTSGDLATQVALNTAAVATAVERTGTANALGFKDVGLQQLQTQYALAQAIKADGDLTRGLIISNNDAELNRRLVVAQNEIIELRGDSRLAERSRGIEITTTNNINQMQQQQQQQAQFSQLYGVLAGLAQNIQATNQAINVGSGLQTANPLNNNTNIR